MRDLRVWNKQLFKINELYKKWFLVCIRQRQDSLSSCNVLMGLQPNFCVKEPENNFLFCYKMSNSYQCHYLFLDCQLWLTKEAIKVNFLAGKLVQYQMVMSYRKYTCNNQRGSGSSTPWSDKKNYPEHRFRFGYICSCLKLAIYFLRCYKSKNIKKFNLEYW